MPTPFEYESKKFNQESLDSLFPSIKSALESDEDELPFDYIMEDLTLDDICRHIEKMKLDQDLPFKSVRITDLEIKNEEVFRDVCEHCSISGVVYDPRLMNKVYFIETADNAIVLIPVQLEQGLINVHIDLLDKEHTPKSIYDMYMKSGKLTFGQILFLKPYQLNFKPKKKR
ncbi:MAG: hypothetical protein KBH94_03275 [Caldisericia bacterium]|nr:hypothetical protein [Caldisericia bacterium]